MLKRKSLLSIAEESTVYTLETLINADSNFNFYDAVATPTIEMIDRPAGDGFSNLSSIPGLQGGEITFKSDLHGSGTGVAPPWANLLFPACGFVKTTNTFAPVSKPPAENGSPDFGIRTLTLALFEDGRRKMIRGAMGTFKIILESGKPSMIEWTFKGAWTDVADATLPTPTYPTQKPIRFANATFTIGGFAPCIQKLEIDAANDVALRECQSASDGTGYRGGLVSDRNVGGTVNPEAQLVSVADPFGDWKSGTESAMSVVIADASDTVTIAVPKMQNKTVGDGERNGLRTDEITWQANRSAAADDEISIAFSATV